MKKLCKRLFKNKKALGLVIAIVVLIAAAILVFALPSKNAMKKISVDQAKTKTEDFVNKFLMPSGSKATIEDVSQEYGLYKMKINIGSGEPVESYVTEDGKLFFPQAIDMNAASQQTANSNSNTSTPTAVNVPKSDKPVIELFVMSYCPYGTQIEKGFLPVLKALDNKVDFQLKFVDYAMHGKKELDENLVQYCITQDEPQHLTDYLQCFLDAGDNQTCLSKTITNVKKINSCAQTTDSKYKVSDNYNNKVDWKGSYPSFNVEATDNQKYNVAGSPTLVINGQEVSSARDSASLLKTVCSAFNTPPAACDTQLSSQTPTPGFGFNYSDTSANSAAACN